MYMGEIKDIVSRMEFISLSEMDGVKLMNRRDCKYWFHRELLADILDSVADSYYILEVEGERDLPYSTLYYDTSEDELYYNHHRGKLNRYKIRRRNYVATQSSFLEIKFKSNTGRTIKIRQASDFDNEEFTLDEVDFIESNTPYSCSTLQGALVSKFRRLMLVSKSMDERCTIDINLHFSSPSDSSSLDNLVVVEVKSDGRSRGALTQALARYRIKPSGFSKYCMGRIVTSCEVKQNRFKDKHRKIDKIVNHSTFKEV